MLFQTWISFFVLLSTEEVIKKGLCTTEERNSHLEQLE